MCQPGRPFPRGLAKTEEASSPLFAGFHKTQKDSKRALINQG